MKYLPTNKKLKNLSQILRRNQTKEEKKLWFDFVKDYEVQFNRQKIIGNYIVDFYCKKANLIIELDGSQHYQKQGEENDIKRTKYFEKLGIQVIRFSNYEINTNFNGICETIDDEVSKRL